MHVAETLTAVETSATATRISIHEVNEDGAVKSCLVVMSGGVKYCLAWSGEGPRLSDVIWYSDGSHVVRRVYEIQSLNELSTYMIHGGSGEVSPCIEP
jgi:hypothetical protein